MERRYVVILLLSLALLFMFVAMATSQELSRQALIVTPVLVSTTGSDNVERDDEMLCGQTAEVLDGPNEHGLFQVKTEYGYTTWMSGQTFQAVSLEEARSWREKRSHMVTEPWADVLPAPETVAYPPVMSLPRGSWVQVTGMETKDRWLPVRLADGRQGFMRKQNIRAARHWGQYDEETTRAHLVDDALAYLGTAYRWGGKSPAGLDCSGLTSMVYMLNGLNIYRNSRPEAGYPIALMTVKSASSEHYSREELTRAGVKPGDLLFWAGHVGLYIGRGRYIHSNGLDFSTTINSLIPDDKDFRADLARPDQVLTWGTVFPREPKTLLLRRVEAVPFTENGKTGYRFYAKADGFAPTRAIVYPEGLNRRDVKIEIERPRFMVMAGYSENKHVPVWFYDQPGKYRPAVELINDHNLLPESKAIRSIGESSKLLIVH